MLELPPAADGPIEEVDFETLALVEKEFSAIEIKGVNEAIQQKNEIDKDQYKRRRLNETDAKDIGVGNLGGRREEANIQIVDPEDSVPHGANSMEVPLSLPRSKSLSNNRSAHSSKVEL